MLVGIGLCFYATHRRLWVWIEPNPAGRGKTRIVIAGRTNKNAFAFEQDFGRLCEGLQAALTKDETQKGGKTNG
jgi:cytochrome c biogenesis protein